MPKPSLHDLWRQHLAQLESQDAEQAAPTPAARPAPRPAPRLDLPDHFDVAAAVEPNLEDSRRGDGWTAQRQHDFLAAVATGATIESAARAQGLSASSAYGFRNSAKGAAFAIGWTAAQLLQRQRLADTVSARAFEGQTVTVTRPDGSTYERHFHDNRLAMSVLGRLDRLAAGQIAAGTPDTTGEGQAARLAAAEFDRYLDVLAAAGDMGGGGGPARAALFLAARTDPAAPGAPELAALAALARADLYTRTGAGTPAELDCTDLDPANRAGWSAHDWARAEAAGLVVLAPPPTVANDIGLTPDSQDSRDGDEEDDIPDVWWDEDAHEYRTCLPLAGDGDLPDTEKGRYGDADYERSLTTEEQALVDAADGAELTALRAEGLAKRAAWLAELRAEAAGVVAPAADPSDPVLLPGAGRDLVAQVATTAGDDGDGEGGDVPVSGADAGASPASSDGAAGAAGRPCDVEGSDAALERR